MKRGASVPDRAGGLRPEPQASQPKELIPCAVHLEIRPDENGKFDEIVARFADGMVRAEMMTDKSIYVGFYWDDGRYCQWWMHSGKALKSNVEQGIDARPSPKPE